jgi:ligand-binding sensor domain-containing protein
VWLFCVYAIQSIGAQERFWIQSNGPFGGAVWAITSDLNGNLYCGARAGTVFQYSQKARSWTPLFAGASRQDIVAIAADHRGRVYFAAVNEPVFAGQISSNSWTKLEGGPPPGETTALAVDSEGLLIAASRSGLFQFNTTGREWKQVTAVDRVVGIRVQKQVRYAFGAGIFRSTVGDREWTRVPGPGPDLTALAIDDRHIFYAGSRAGEVFRRPADGNWEKILSFPNNAVAALEVDERGRLFIGLGGPGFSSEGGGLYVLPRDRTEAIKVFEDNSNGVPELLMDRGTMLAGTNEGVWRSDDGGSKWTRFNTGLIAQRVNDIVIDRSDAVYAGSYGGVFRSTDNGQTWTERNTGLAKDIGILDMAADADGRLFIGTYLAGIYRSIDSGASWQKLNTGIERTPGNWIMNVAVTSRGHVFACVLDTGVFHSADHGATWTPVAAGVFQDKCHALVVDSRDRVYAANSKGDLFRSDDGVSWRKLPASNPPLDDPSEIIVDSHDRIYFGGSTKGVFRFVEDEGRWHSLNDGLPAQAIRSLLFAGDALFVGTSGATDYQAFDGNDLFQSSDQGSTWSKQTSGLHHPRVKALATNSKGVVFAGTWGGGVYRSVRPVRR